MKKKTLTFYRGIAPKGENFDWVMHEYQLEGKLSTLDLPKLPKYDQFFVPFSVSKSLLILYL